MFATMTLLADVSSVAELSEWGEYGATYTVLWDVDNESSISYQVLDRPMFMVLDTDMTILLRMSNRAGQQEAEELIDKLLAD